MKIKIEQAWIPSGPFVAVPDSFDEISFIHMQFLAIILGFAESVKI